jgi:DNA-binding MarR family transcriptional regulator
MKVNLQSLGRSVKRLQTRHHRMLDARLVEIGSTLAQWDALRAISENPGASSHDLAEFTFQTDQSFGALALRHGLTAQGKRLLAEASKAADRVLAESFAPLTEAERVQFLSLIARLLRAGLQERSL